VTRRVLIVSYFFPPHPSVASLRLRGLARYLGEFGWEPVVLTATHPQAPRQEPCRVVRAHDPGELSVLLKQRLGLARDRSFQEQLGVPESLRSRRRSWAKRLFLRAKGLVIYPDDMRPWGGYAKQAGEELLARERFDAILSSSGPATVNRVARHLRERTRTPWLADFRDLWTQKHDYAHGGLRRRIERRLELKTLAGADRLVTVSGPLAEQLAQLHRKPVEVIPNGFDPDELAPPGIEPAPGFRILYSGSLYQGAMDPLPLLRAWGRLRAQGGLRDARLDVYGDAPPWLGHDVVRHGLGDVVTLHNRVSRAEVLELQRRARMLLLLGWRDRSQRGITTGKVFEYLAAGRPILAIDCARGDTIDALLRETGAGWSCADEGELERRLLTAYGEWGTLGDVQWSPQPAAIDGYSHRSMARRFAAELDQLVLSSS